MIKISDKAVEEFKRILEETEKTNFGIKFIKAGSNCCGSSYRILIVNKDKDEDVTIEKNGVKFFFDKEVYEDLDNAIIDYNKGFIIDIKPSQQ